MEFKSQTHYKGASDEELVRLILTPPHNEEAAVFLLYNRYGPNRTELAQISNNSFVPF